MFSVKMRRMLLFWCSVSYMIQTFLSSMTFLSFIGKHTPVKCDIPWNSDTIETGELGFRLTELKTESHRQRRVSKVNRVFNRQGYRKKFLYPDRIGILTGGLLKMVFQRRLARELKSF